MGSFKSVFLWNPSTLSFETEVLGRDAQNGMERSLRKLIREVAMKRLFLSVVFSALGSIALAQSTVSDQSSSNVATSTSTSSNSSSASSIGSISNCSGAGCQMLKVMSSCNRNCTGSATVNGKTTTYTGPSGQLFIISVSRTGVVSSNGTVSSQH
ncbi:MAG: hypothetical protein ACLPJJ_10735 [Acidocella sp.]|uniref:hypothetical protein n=1 Tax=Acidocella sp. TaxID=50710 RepID=UPI003FD79580